ncbi:MAG: 50S ribosomal protein L4 [Campylobacterales bacterium]|nr:50S ribosomal protein L4 [Campylobacterales bacterium]
MAEAIVLNEKFENSGKAEVPAKYEEINSHNLYLFNKAYLANARAASAHTKNRSAVAGGGKKPWSQKGGGRARAGSITSPVFVGGGRAFGPTNERNYTQKVNKKQKTLALQFALNEKAKAEALFVVPSVAIESGKTKDAAALVNKVGSRDVLVVVDTLDEKTYLAYRNLPNAALIFASELNAYVLSVYRTVIMKQEVFDQIVKEA